MTPELATMNKTTNDAGSCEGECCRRPGCCGSPAVPLTALKTGECGVVCETCLADRDAAMLRAMGLRPSARIRVCRLGEPCIVEVLGANPAGCGCRIGLARPLAERIMVGPER